MCDCPAKLRAYADDLRTWSKAMGKHDARAGHATHDADHYEHAAQILEGREAIVADAISATPAAWRRQS